MACSSCDEDPPSVVGVVVEVGEGVDSMDDDALVVVVVVGIVRPDDDPKVVLIKSKPLIMVAAEAEIRSFIDSMLLPPFLDCSLLSWSAAIMLTAIYIYICIATACSVVAFSPSLT